MARTAKAKVWSENAAWIDGQRFRRTNIERCVERLLGRGPLDFAKAVAVILLNGPSTLPAVREYLEEAIAHTEALERSVRSSNQYAIVGMLLEAADRHKAALRDEIDQLPGDLELITLLRRQVGFTADQMLRSAGELWETFEVNPQDSFHSPAEVRVIAADGGTLVIEDCWCNDGTTLTLVESDFSEDQLYVELCATWITGAVREYDEWSESRAANA